MIPPNPKRLLFRTWVCAGALLLLPAAEADEGERAQLARISHELFALDQMVRDAEVQGGRGRVRFQYDWLRSDLARVRAGIEQYLNDPPELPQAVPPLRGDYRR